MVLKLIKFWQLLFVGSDGIVGRGIYPVMLWEVIVVLFWEFNVSCHPSNTCHKMYEYVYVCMLAYEWVWLICTPGVQPKQLDLLSISVILPSFYTFITLTSHFALHAIKGLETIFFFSPFCFPLFFLTSSFNVLNHIYFLTIFWIISMYRIKKSKDSVFDGCH